MKRDGKREAFVLLMVLLVLTIAGTLLAATAGRCSRQALSAGAAGRRLQVTWGARSCKAFFLPAAERMLQPLQGRPPEPVVTERRSLELGGVRFEMILSDEQAKANVNLLWADHGEQHAASSLSVLKSDPRGMLAVQLRPGVPDEKVIRSLPLLFGSYDQLFIVWHPRDLVGAEEIGQPGQSQITCWGNGKVNFKNAPMSVMHHVLADVLTESQLDELVKLRLAVPDCTLEEAISHLELKEAVAQRVRKALTDTSLCHSLWVIARGRTRDWYSLFVEQTGDAENDSQSWSFHW